MKSKRILGLILSGLLITACFVGAASAEEWTGWTYKDSQFERFSDEWVQDVQQHVREYIYDPTKDFEWRAKAQSYVLGWDDRITYVDEHAIIEYQLQDENGDWIESSAIIIYDWGFFGNLFGWGVPENLFQNKSEYDSALLIYNDNSNRVSLQRVPREV